METQKKIDRQDAWREGGSIQIVSVSAFGDPMDCSEEEAREFAMKILRLCDEENGQGDKG